MCGFFGIVFEERNGGLGQILNKAGERLSYRGYDTAGIAVFDKNSNYKIFKDKGTIEEVSDEFKFKEKSGYKGIIQLRWATFGAPSKENAQPHDDCKGEIVGAHNGNIVNTHGLIKELSENGHTLKGVNDGEMIIHILEEEMAGTGDFGKAIINTNTRINGDYAFIATPVSSDKMYAVKKGSSLFLGIADGYICASSDLISILDHTDKIIPILDNEYVEFTYDKYEIKSLLNGSKIERKPEINNLNVEEIKLGGYSHFMEKEIFESPQKFRNLLDVMEKHDAYKEAIKTIRNANNIYLVGSGTSYHAGRLGTYYFSKIDGLNINATFAADFIERYGHCIKDGDLLIAVSQSGETKDVKNAVDYFKKKVNGKVMGVVNVLGSTLAYNADIVLPIVSDIEISVPATKTFINQCGVFLYLATAYSGKGIDRMREIPALIEDFLRKEKEHLGKLAEILKNERDLHVLGYGIMYPIAMEGALKMKEVMYIHSEGMYSSEFKHGPLAIVYDNYPVIFLATSEDKDMIISHINEVKTRMGSVYTLAPYDKEIEEISDYFIPLDNAEYFTSPILAGIGLQLLSYLIGVKNGRNPDRPRNISKTITVD
ncbi:MAG: glutamine--fructose-6-phosphate transaminase (isomerizing) [Proteobacteria bacterium]|nr:glutamine--fructose-6-phosphate transaminase (isomerizing) [Pseudomonadota bacterium]